MNRSLAVLATLLFTAPVFAAPLDPLFAGENLWAQKQDQFMAAARILGFQWTSSARDSARAAGNNMTAYDLPVVESLARFDTGTLKEVTVVFYARSDVDDWNEERFDSLVRSAAEAVNKTTGTKFTVRGKDPSSAVKADGLLWTADNARYLLEYSKTKAVKSRGQPFRAEFVRLEITPPVKTPALTAETAKPARTKFSGAAHVKRNEETGDVWIGDVPMVNQGTNGYSVLACSERLMRYYGFDVDKQELAQATNASWEGALSYAVMIETLKKIGVRQKFKVREILRYDSGEFRRTLTDYNRAAKRLGAPLLTEPQGRWSPNDYYPMLRYAVLKDVKMKNKADASRLLRQVQTSIAEGVPPLWCVILGIVPEPDSQQAPIGATRLIIGYNERTQEVIFTDSWGAGHEKKRMALADAWTVTTDLLAIEPF